MDYLAVVAAAIGGYAFGAVWYMALSKPWMEAAGLTEEQVKAGGARPYAIAFISALLVAGMMRHAFAQAGIDAPGKGLLAGLGIGLFLAAPWIANNHAFGGRPFRLSIIDGGYAAGGSAVIGLILALF